MSSIEASSTELSETSVSSTAPVSTSSGNFYPSTDCRNITILT